MPFVQRHWKLLLAGAVAAVGLAWVAFGYFGVQFLFIDDRVDQAGPVFASGATGDDVESTPGAAAETEAAVEPQPTVGPEPTAVATAEPEPSVGPEPTAGATAESEPESAATAPTVVELVEGSFIDRAHPTSGRAVVLNDGSEQRFLRFEEFATDNGPDLNVYLVAADATDDDAVFDDDFVDLGNLAGNIGDQNYEIPAEVDLDRYDAVVIWCVRFSVSFGAADLS